MLCNEVVSHPCVWIEGKAKVRDLVHEMVEKIVTTPIPCNDGGEEPSRWNKVYDQKSELWVEYTRHTRNEAARYIHEDGTVYNVYQLSEYNGEALDEDGYLWEVKDDAPYNDFNPIEYRTGRKINVVGFYVDSTYYEIPGALAVLIDVNPNIPESMFENPWDKYKAYLVKHSRVNYLGEEVEDVNWNGYKIVAEMPDDWNYFLYKGSILLYRKRVFDPNDQEYEYTNITYRRNSYNVRDSVYFNSSIKSFPCISIFECEIDNQIYNVYFEKPVDNNNYIIVKYDVQISLMGNVIGASKETYELACDLESIGYDKTPIIINQEEAYKAYERQINDEFVPPYLSLNDEGSPPSYFFFSCDITDSWVSQKKKPETQMVHYYISMNNYRLLIILEGDPGYDFDSYYRSFAYIGKFNSFNNEDNETNFAVTVGMGELEKNKTGFKVSDVDKKNNPTYTKYGRYTSDGMTTISVLRGATGIPYQEYRPALLTQLPNYPNVGTLPSGLKRLLLERHGFQESKWTNHIHASPVYIVNGYEGYRGYLDGLVAVYSHNILNGDELEYDNGSYIEVYKFFNLRSPVNMFNMSAAPNISVAILKEINNKE